MPRSVGQVRRSGLDLRSAWAARPTKRSPSSSYCSGSGGDGASSIGSVPDWVLGKAMTSRMLVWSARSAAQRSMPSAMPPCGGAPYSNASRMAPNLLAHALERLALEREAALEQVAPMDPDRAATELPAVEREVVLERPGAAGRVVGRRLGRVAGRGHEQRLVLGDDAAERVVGRVPAPVLLVPLVHREAVDPDVGEDGRVGQAEALAELDAQAAEDVRA